MFFARINNLHRTLAFRLTFWYALLFIFSAGVVFVLSYMLISSVIRQRTDDDLLSRRNEFARIYALEGIETLQRSAAFQAQAAGEKKVFYRLFYHSGVVFSSSNMTHWKGIGIDRNAVLSLFQDAAYVYVTHKQTDGNVRARVIYSNIGSSIILQMGYSVEEDERLLQIFKRIFTVTMSAMLVLAVAGGWFMARRALSGVAMVTRTASRISEDDLQTRVPVRYRHNEIDLLAITFNQMLDRIQRLVTGIRQMNDNIAHDLRSPITRIRGLAEVTLTNDASMDDFKQMGGSTIEECDRLLDMINTMLTISRTEAGMHPDSCTHVNLAEIVIGAFELFEPLAQDKSITLDKKIDGAAFVKGDQRMLQRMVANLIDNGIKYAGPGCHVTVGLFVEPDQKVRLTIEDNGMGVTPDDLPKIFHRFFRSDQSRSAGGAGLGLSLVKAIVHAHGGEIHVESQPEKGTLFTISLPLIDECQTEQDSD